MAKNTPNYKFEKPEQNDFYDVDVQNRNWDKAETALTEFDDSGSVDEIKSFPDFLKKFVTGNKLAVTMRNLKAGMQFVLHAGQIVNNCVTDNAGLPLSAAQGKALMDKYTQLYSEVGKNLIQNDTIIASQAFAVGLSTFEVTDKIPAIPDGYERIASVLYTTQNYLLAQLTFTARHEVFVTVLNGHPSQSITSDIRCVQLYRLKN